MSVFMQPRLRCQTNPSRRNDQCTVSLLLIRHLGRRRSTTSSTVHPTCRHAVADRAKQRRSRLKMDRYRRSMSQIYSRQPFWKRTPLVYHSRLCVSRLLVGTKGNLQRLEWRVVEPYRLLKPLLTVNMPASVHDTPKRSLDLTEKNMKAARRTLQKSSSCKQSLLRASLPSPKNK